MSRYLAHVEYVKHLLPFDDKGNEMYHKFRDGLLLCALVNRAQSDTIHESGITTEKLNIYKCCQNLTLGINSAQAIGCSTISIDSNMLYDGDETAILSLVWQLIEKCSLSKIILNNTVGIESLMDIDESSSDFMKLNATDKLLRWINFHLQKDNAENPIVGNFGRDLRDSSVYLKVLKQVAPRGTNVPQDALLIQDLDKRAEAMLKEAGRMECGLSVHPSDISECIDKINIAFMCEIFNKYPGLRPRSDASNAFQETREEKTYRNWMNSLVDRTHVNVNYLYSDLTNGIIFFRIYDIIKRDQFQWSMVYMKTELIENLMIQNNQKVNNCSYALKIGREKFRFDLIGISGTEICRGEKIETLTIVWQMMRAYTLALLEMLGENKQPISEKQILEWANQMVSRSKSKHATSISGFGDKKIRTSIPIICLIEVIQPNSIDWKVVNTNSENQSHKDNEGNAKYAVTIARKIGAPVYALPEDIQEGNDRMIMTVYASLMISERKSQKEAASK